MILKDENMSHMSFTIYQIVHYIRSEENYDEAARLMVENNLTLTSLFSLTCKLTQIQFATLADKVTKK